MIRPSLSTARLLLFSALLVCLASTSAMAVELKADSAAAFARYLGASDARVNSELHSGPYLFIDALPSARRAQAYAQLRDGQVLVKQVNTREDGFPINVPHGLIHDWVGVLFIPNATLAQTLAVVQNYDDYQNIYKPQIRQSRLLSRDGDNFKVFLQLYKKSIITVAINADFDIHYEYIGPNRAANRSYATRLVELQHVDQPNERELPANDAHGFLWRLSDYWRVEQKDGGVYVQFESIGLSRSVPAIFAWLVDPLLQSIPRGTLTGLLAATRAAVASSTRTGALSLDSQPTAAEHLTQGVSPHAFLASR